MGLSLINRMTTGSLDFYRLVSYSLFLNIRKNKKEQKNMAAINRVALGGCVGSYITLLMLRIVLYREPDSLRISFGSQCFNILNNCFYWTSLWHGAQHGLINAVGAIV